MISSIRVDIDLAKSPETSPHSSIRERLSIHNIMQSGISIPEQVLYLLSQRVLCGYLYIFDPENKILVDFDRQVLAQLKQLHSRLDYSNETTSQGVSILHLIELGLNMGKYQNNTNYVDAIVNIAASPESPVLVPKTLIPWFKLYSMYSANMLNTEVNYTINDIDTSQLSIFNVRFYAPTKTIHLGIMYPKVQLSLPQTEQDLKLQFNKYECPFFSILSLCILPNMINENFQNFLGTLYRIPYMGLRYIIFSDLIDDPPQAIIMQRLQLLNKILYNNETLGWDDCLHLFQDYQELYNIKINPTLLKLLYDVYRLYAQYFGVRLSAPSPLAQLALEAEADVTDDPPPDDASNDTTSDQPDDTAGADSSDTSFDETSGNETGDSDAASASEDSDTKTKNTGTFRLQKDQLSLDDLVTREQLGVAVERLLASDQLPTEQRAFLRVLKTEWFYLLGFEDIRNIVNSMTKHINPKEQ